MHKMLHNARKIVQQTKPNTSRKYDVNHQLFHSAMINFIRALLSGSMRDPPVDRLCNLLFNKILKNKMQKMSGELAQCDAHAAFVPIVARRAEPPSAHRNIIISDHSHGTFGDLTFGLM